MIEIKAVDRKIYITKDGKEFLSENEAKNHERYINKIKFFEVKMLDTTEGRRLTRIAVIKIISSYGYHETYATQQMYLNNLGIDYVQGFQNCMVRGILEEITEQEFKDESRRKKIILDVDSKFKDK